MSDTIIAILCIVILLIYSLLGVTILIHSIADIFDSRRRVKREEEYHELRMKGLD